MFTGFCYTLRKHEIDVSLTEWMTMLEALDMGLAKSSLTEFYYLSRAILAKTEREYDSFDAAFLEYFKDANHCAEIPPEWLSRLDADGPKQPLMQRPQADSTITQGYIAASNEVSDMAPAGEGAAFLTEGGAKMVGSEMARSAFDLAGSRTFRDFRDDIIINERQYQTVLRRLRQLSRHADIPESELDVDATIHKTCDKGNILHVVMRKPRRNIVKLMLLIDSGGSMQAYSKLCTALFKAAMKSNSFQDLKIYYFHNCIYNNLYTDPTCRQGTEIHTEWVLRNIDGEYKVVIVGDATMAPAELTTANYQARRGEESLPGTEWMRRFKKKYRKIVWLNPEDEAYVWRDMFTRRWLEAEFDTYVFTLRNFEIAMKKLLAG